MNRRSHIACAAGLGIIALTGLGLTHVQSLQRVGVPGVRVVPHQVFTEGDRLIGTNSIPLPETVLNFTSHEERIAKTVSDWLPKDTTFAQRIYEAPDKFWIQANVVLMGTDRTSIHKPEYCLAGQGFRTRKVERETIRITEPHPYDLPVMKMTVDREVVTKGGAKVQQTALYVFWFVADQQLSADHNERMWWMARDLITKGLLQRWAYVSCFAVCGTGQEDAGYARVRDWIAAAVPQFQVATGPRRGGKPGDQ
jgi:uncharacterized protein DUF3485